MEPWAALAVGLGAAGLGGEIFIRGAVGVARAARVATATIGVTVAAFATSSPELSVAVNSALAGTPRIALGDALGSNVVNVALILALAALASPIAAPMTSLRRDFPVAIAAAPFIAVLSWDGRLSRGDGLLLLTVFGTWLASVLIEARRQRRSGSGPVPASHLVKAGLLCATGLACLVLAGRMVVIGATGIGRMLGLDPFVIGATMVSVGTSIPELATTVVAQLRRHSDISLGNILGSNIFNAFLIVAVAALVRPIQVAWTGVTLGLGFGTLAVILAVPRRGLIGRTRACVLLAVYVVYVATLLRVR